MNETKTPRSCLLIIRCHAPCSFPRFLSSSSQYIETNALPDPYSKMLYSVKALTGLVAFTTFFVSAPVAAGPIPAPPPPSHGNVTPGKYPITDKKEYARPIWRKKAGYTTMMVPLGDGSSIIPVVPGGLDASKPENLCVLTILKQGPD